MLVEITPMTFELSENEYNENAILPSTLKELPKQLINTNKVIEVVLAWEDERLFQVTVENCEQEYYIVNEASYNALKGV